VDLSRTAWRKSTFSKVNSCVEIALFDSCVAVRDSKDRSGAVLVFTAADWDAFISGLRNGEFDLPTEPTRIKVGRG
jgi:ABC-type amino acid transport substrate-binding protein